MVLVNNNEFDIYELDTMESILNRLATTYNTVPKYLYFPGGIPDMNTLFKTKDNIVVENLYQTILNYANRDIDFKDLYENVKDKIGQNNLNIYTDILKPFVVYNRIVRSQSDVYQDGLLFEIFDQINKLGLKSNRDDINQWFNNRVEIEKSNLALLNDVKKKVVKDTKLFQQLNEIKKGIPSTNFELEKITLRLTIELENNEVSLMEIFNAIVLDNYIPFAAIENGKISRDIPQISSGCASTNVISDNKYYKILKNFTPYESWAIIKNQGITFRVLEKNIKSENNNFYIVKMEDYATINLYIEKVGETQKITAIMKVSTSINNVPMEETMRRFLVTINSLNPKITDVKEVQVNGVFYFPNQEMDVNVLQDLVLNNPLFSSLLVINEAKKSTIEKDSTYIYFNLPRIGKVTANLTEKVMNKNDPLMKNKDKSLFTVNSKYTRVKVTRANNSVSVDEFKNILSKLFVIYNNEYASIVEYYRKFIPGFGVKEVIETVPVKVTLKDIVPELFLPLYSRRCTNRPTIISDEEKVEAEKEGKQVMVFPLPGDENLISRNYVCNHPKHIYPGLRKNPFENKETYPYLPCCYIKNQDEIKESIYRQYFYGENVPDKDIKQQDLFTSNKFVPKNKFGTLPTDINKLFKLLEPSNKYIFLRQGVIRSKSSFLICVLQAINNDIINIEDDAQIENYIRIERTKLATKELAAACKQELYDLDEKEILQLIGDSNVYLDPKLFVHLLEVAYSCNIFIFTRTSSGGEMILPRHLESYLKNKWEKRCIFIFAHIGSESDNAEYPQCELIIKWNTEDKNDITDMFDYKDNISQGVINVFNELKKSYILDKELQDSSFKFNFNPISQVIDNYGKSRMFNFNYKNNIITLLTNPIQPLPIAESTDTNVKKIDIGLALDFAASMNILISGQTIFNNSVKNIFGKLGNINIIIPINDSKEIEGIPAYKKSVYYPENNVSDLDTYNNNKKISRYLVEYMFWLYSWYIYNNKIEILDVNSIKKFVDDKIVIIPGYEYENIGNKFSNTNNSKGFILQDGKLVVTSKEMLKRLIFILRLQITRDKPSILSYKNKEIMPNYYVDITDFVTYSNQIILLGEDSVNKWIREKKINYDIQDTVKENTTEPYFFKNILIDNNVYIAQNTDTLNKAIKIGKVWKNYGYNIGSEANIDNDIEPYVFTLYLYSNNQSIVKKYINAYNADNYKIIGYKNKENKPNYTILLAI